ncbi:MAG: FkbM family methyltransferase [Bacteroidales bacterium]
MILIYISFPIHSHNYKIYLLLLRFCLIILSIELKESIKLLLQRLLGIERYLYVFSRFTILTLRFNNREKDFLHFVNILDDGGIILDIGANIGVMTYYLSKRKPNSLIIAFEPIPENLKTLNKILNHYKLANVTVVDKALGDKSGKVEMVMPVLNSVKMQGLSHIVHESLTDFNEGDKYKVDVETLDSFIPALEEGKKVTGMKLDVENFEYFVLKGGAKLIDLFQPIIYTELWENENRNKCFDLLKQKRYSIFVLDKGQLVDYNIKSHITQNFFFVPSKVKK